MSSHTTLRRTSAEDTATLESLCASLRAWEQRFTRETDGILTTPETVGRTLPSLIRRRVRTALTILSDWAAQSESEWEGEDPECWTEQVVEWAAEQP
jgi:hypothetical protein